MTRQRDRARSVFFCPTCGFESPKWMGFCPSPSCGSGQPLVEGNARAKGATHSPWVAASSADFQELSELDSGEGQRIELPCRELNRALGGGIVPGSVVLLAGEPGVGKSTLLLQVARYMSEAGQTSVYVAGEESPQQIKLRSERLGFSGRGVLLLSETDVDTVINRLDECRPSLAIFDSIQTMYCPDVASAPGTVGQVREAGLRLMRWSKARQVPVVLAGHVTKDGSVAGPRTLEHMVDVVISLESQEFGSLRLLRCSKNRFGSTYEVGVFEMSGRGLIEVEDPSKAILEQRYAQAVGAALTPVLEGTRPMVLEVQALTSPSHLPAPRRVANGLDFNRLLMLIAVAGRRGGLDLSGQDIIVNVAGGLKVSEPAADLAVVLAIGSSLHNRPLDPGLVAFGELGLGGEVRSVPQAQRRLQEAQRLGLGKAVLPASTPAEETNGVGLDLSLARTVRQALQAGLGGPRP